MSKIAKIIKLINLLSHRRYVTLEAIASTCDIPERTAYRYLNTISEANIPVFYDRERRAYRLNARRSMFINNIELGDALLISLALRFLAMHVDEEYGEEITELIDQIMIRQPGPLEDVMKTFEQSIAEQKRSDDYSDLISTIMLHAAIGCDRQVRLTGRRDDSGSRTEAEIEHPRLLFQRGWQIVEANDDGREAISLRDVARVSIP